MRYQEIDDTRDCLWSTVVNFLTRYNASPKRVAFFRIFFGFIVLLNLTVVGGHITEFYSNEGFFPAAFIKAQFPDRLSLLYLFDSGWWPHLLFCILITSIVCFIAGWFPRCMAAVMFILIASFQNRDLYHTYGGDSVIRHVTFLSIFLRSDGAWVLGRSIVPQEVQNAWALRLILIQVACIYLFAAISKFSSNDWMTGQYLYGVMNYPYRSYLPLRFLEVVPVAANLITYLVLAVEYLFAFLVWHPTFRRPLVLTMLLFHLGIFFTFNVVYFSIVMMAILPAFLSDEEHRQFRLTLFRGRVFA